MNPSTDKQMSECKSTETSEVGAMGGTKFKRKHSQIRERVSQRVRCQEHWR